MNQVILKSRVGADGVLRVTLPIGVADANSEVRITIDPVFNQRPTKAEWDRWVDSVAGSWQGPLERPAQGEFEVREPM